MTPPDRAERDDPYGDRKTCHLASKFATDGSGRISALCFKRPHAIDMERETWTTDPTAVTCPKCQLATERLAMDRATRGKTERCSLTLPREDGKAEER